MTLRELAKVAHVSVSTASKAFHDAEDVSEETRRHVFEVAKRHGVFGKFYKGKYNKKIIAIICPEIQSAYYSEYVRRMQKQLESNNAIALIATDFFDERKQAQLIEYFEAYIQVDGIIVFGLKCKIKERYDRIPIVSMLGGTQENVDSIHVNFKTSIKESVQYLRELGHRKIAFIGEKLTTEKEKHFFEAVEFLDGIFYSVCSDERFEEAGMDGVKRILESGKIPTAIICAYDDIAIGAMKHLYEQGYFVPEDISIIGIDNIGISRYLQKSLTSIDSNPDEVCKIAWKLLQSQFENRFCRQMQHVTVDGKLIIRDTTASPQ